MSEFTIELITSLVKIAACMGIIMTGAALVILADRRFSAFIQDRLGPNRVGPEGLFQPVADFLKLITKEEFSPDTVEKPIYLLAPIVILVPALIIYSVIPFGHYLHLFGLKIPMQIANVNIGILFIFAISSIGVYGIVLGGWSANNKYSLFGGLRSSAQMISYELALGLAAIGVLMLTGSLKLNLVVENQAAYWGGIIPKWNIFLQPVAFIIFLVAAFAETNRLPFDLVEAEQELVGGYHTEYGSMRFAFFFLAEYCNLITASALVVTLFFGGWHLPWLDKISMPQILLDILQIGAFVLKTAFFVIVFVWVRWTLPRFKYNQLMALGWKVFLPLAIVNILVTGIVYIIIY